MTDTAAFAPFGPALGFATNPIDRLEARRNDADHIASLARDERGLAVVLIGDDVVLRGDGAAWFPLEQARALPSPALEVLLGLRDEQGRFAVALDAAAAEAVRARSDVTITDLRSIAVAGVLPAEEVGALAQAKSVLGWHGSHRFCPNCGTLTVVAAAGWRRECPRCGRHHFPRTDPVVIMMAVDGERCLLGRQPRFPPGMYSCLAGFLEPGETVEDAVRRELMEEAGIATGAVRYRGSQPWPFPFSVMIGCVAEATTTAVTIDHAELDDARWFDRAETLALLAGEHEGGLRCPPPMAIAHHLMRDWAEGGERP